MCSFHANFESSTVIPVHRHSCHHRRCVQVTPGEAASNDATADAGAVVVPSHAIVLPMLEPYAAHTVHVSAMCELAGPYRIVARICTGVDVAGPVNKNTSTSSGSATTGSESGDWSTVVKTYPHAYRELKTASVFTVVMPLQCQCQIMYQSPVFLSSNVTSSEDGALHVPPSPDHLLGRVAVGSPFLVHVSLASMTEHPVRVHSVSLTQVPTQLSPAAWRGLAFVS